MKKTDLLVIGGSAGGILSANTARKAYGDIKITVIRDTQKVMVPCGIPYIFGRLKDTSKNAIPDGILTNNDIEIMIDKVIKIDKENKVVETKNNELIEYKRLIIATGSLPFIPTFIPGHDLENVYTVLKEENYLKKVLEKTKEAENIVVIGGGFIGVEFAEQMRLLDKNVTLVELADACLWQAFDKKFTNEIEENLRENGIKVKTKTKVEKILGNTKVEAVQLDSGERIKADLVILGMGVKPNAKLAKDAGLELNEKGAIVVDQYTRTSNLDIFAVGDCAEKKCFFTGKNVPVLLASTAATEAKIAGCNAFQLRLIRQNKGTISAFTTKFFSTTYAAAGMTEAKAREEGFSIMIGEFSTFDKHPGSLPNTKKINIKLIFSKCSGVILGAQISGGDSVGEMINILSLAIQKGITASELNTFQVATHPLVSASPVAYPINEASMNAISKNCKHLNEDFQI
ncbi:FAD-dependent oxidoreductase [Marinisporobacter balticus]|uniref:NADPH-dependent 2,4-dienoyl-CoA reductase/sulfur reductase-like enzyme n=1 Tax=Marinisporobacter balticus TaxID=2018667 RepID=A0A4V2SBG7_9FIRM|nr:FAD-dependent oxidoreductase [Marinisporobacter balticus]TCO75190.1 NADPH-dependent 2,4-dienoyl-CoA reductase/sulfur reductase-like enzyme [Marinisporobacter balticus]